MVNLSRFVAFTIGVSLFAAGAVRADDMKEAASTLKMSKPVVCLKVHGFGSFEEWPDAKLTPDDKLTIYYEPSGFRTEKTKDGYRALFSEDGRLRKKGSKDAIWKNDDMFKYEATKKFPPYQVYLKTDVSIKALAPGEYELDLTLHDRLDKRDVALTKTVAFTVYLRPEPKPEP